MTETAPPNSEEALALDFAERHADAVRYVAKWGMWFEWDGKCWRVDETRKIFSLARNLCRDAANNLNKGSTRRTIASAKTRAAVVSLASEDRRLAATVDQWDADPWLLNTPDGVIDLRTSELQPARPEDYMTKITAVAPDASCPMPLWDAFLEKVTKGDKEYQKYLARVCGYSLTGLTLEHAMFFLYGDGSNGKGVMVNTVSNIVRDYHVTAPIETFTESKTDRHPTELAMLRGARLVTAVETEEGRRWAERRIKMLTGGDPLRARFDKELQNKLIVEWPGILWWMIAGCIAWQKIGLAPPKVVTEATDDYLQGEDTLQLWIDDCCVVNPNVWSTVGGLFSIWSEWATALGEFVGTIRRFSERLEAHGFKPLRKNDRGFVGLEIKKNVIQGWRRWEPDKITEPVTEPVRANGLSRKISEAQIRTIKKLIADSGVSLKKFLAYCNVEAVADIAAANFDGLSDALKKKASARGRAKS